MSHNLSLQYDAVSGNVLIKCSGPCDHVFVTTPADTHYPDECTAPPAPAPAPGSSVEEVGARILELGHEEVAKLMSILSQRVGPPPPVQK